MEDERWGKQDKLKQLREVLTLYENTKSNNAEKQSTIRKKQTKEINNLTTQNKKYRQQYEDALNGGKQNLLPVLHAHPKQELAFKRLNGNQIEEELKQSIFCKNKEIDRLRYKRKNLEEEFLRKKLELAELKKDAEDTPENYQWEQELTNKIQSVSVKQNAAKTNRKVYEKARDILKNDAIRFDEVLNGLKRDLSHQCESIVKAVDIGQNVTEELSRLEREYKETEKSVRSNMRQRDRAIRSLKAEVDSIRQYGHSSMRESRVVLPTLPGHSTAQLTDEESGHTLQETLDQHVKQEIATIEDSLRRIKEAAAVHRLQDIVPRIEDQRRQKRRLTKQIQENEEQLNKMLDLHNQLDVMREVVMYHTMTDEAVQMREERQQLRTDIEAESDVLKAAKEELIAIGERIVDVRTAVLSMNMMLDTVYWAEGSVMDLGLSVVSDLLPAGGALQPLFQPNTEALTLIDLVVKKVRWLIEQVASGSGRPAPPETAVDTLEQGSKLGAEDEADHIVSSMLADLEDMEDPSVLTRKDIKAESQRLVDLHDDPRAMFQQSSLPKFKKHQCF